MSEISVIHFVSGDLWAGAENCVYQLIQEQAHDPSLKVSAIILNSGQLTTRVRSLGVDVELIDESKYSTITILIKSLIHLRKKAPAIVHTHRRKENIVGSICTFLISGLASVRTVHGGQEFTAPRFSISRFIDFVDFLCAKWVQKSIIFVSEELREREGQRYNQRKVTVVENGIYVEIIRKSSDKPVRAPTISENQVYLYAGRLTAVKRIDLILEAAVELSKSDRAISFLIAGTGPMEQSIRTFVNTHKLEKR